MVFQNPQFLKDKTAKRPVQINPFCIKQGYCLMRAKNWTFRLVLEGPSLVFGQFFLAALMNSFQCNQAPVNMGGIKLVHAR